MHDITRILSALEPGDTRAAEKILPLVYDELRKLAAQRIALEKPGQTLQATALVHEAYLRLVGPGNGGQVWNGRGHFFGAAAEAMRRILVEAYRHKGRAKRGGNFQRVDMVEVPAPLDEPADDLLAVDGALDALARFDPLKAEVVKLRYFAGLTIEQTADCLNLSPATVKRHWEVARAWMYRHLSADDPEAANPDF